MSYSPSRIRRNSIFSERRPRQTLFKSSVVTSNINPSELQALEKRLTTYLLADTKLLLLQIDQNSRTIEMLSAKLRENEEEINKKKYEMHFKGNKGELIEELIEAELNKRLSIVSKKFSEMQDLFVVNMFPTNQQPVLELAPEQTRNFIGTESDFNKLKGQMDEKLNEMLLTANNSKDSITKKCWEIGEQIRINQETIESMNQGMSNIKSKIFSIQSTFRSIQSGGEDFKKTTDNKITSLKQQLSALNSQIFNIKADSKSPMMMKRKEGEFQRFNERSREGKEKKERVFTKKNLKLKQPEEILIKPHRMEENHDAVRSIRDFRREVLNKDEVSEISEISSISSSVSFLSNPVFIPKTKINPSLASSPHSKHLANTKVTTLPLKSTHLAHSAKPLLQDSEDQFLDLYRQSSLQLTKQIMSPFEQAEYITQNNPLDNTQPAFTLPLKAIAQSSLEQKIRQTIWRKNMVSPIPAYLDSNGYIKKSNGAYLFDWQGDVFKTTQQQFKRLCNLRIFVEK